MDGAVPATLTVLASGSSGNAALIRAGDFGLLIDLGVGPRTLAKRLTQAGLGWDSIDAIILTHTHSDHWRETALGYAHGRGTAVYCHHSHINYLLSASHAFGELQQSGCVSEYEPGRPFSPGGGLNLVALELEHDSHRTFGFRVEDAAGAWAAGYVADLGGFDDALVQSLCDVDLLALEFNHDEAMQWESGRPRELIDRILGPRGHLSNRQAGDLVLSVVHKSSKVRPHTIVPLHLSRECNRSSLAEDAARDALKAAKHEAAVVVSTAECAGPSLPIRPHHSASAGDTLTSSSDSRETTSPEVGTSTPPRQT
jgi:phosphoribosyl 1,2-cyclic phosphodiesterase